MKNLNYLHSSKRIWAICELLHCFPRINLLRVMQFLTDLDSCFSRWSRVLVRRGEVTVAPGAAQPSAGRRGQKRGAGGRRRHVLGDGDRCQNPAWAAAGDVWRRTPTGI